MLRLIKFHFEKSRAKKNPHKAGFNFILLEINIPINRARS